MEMLERINVQRRSSVREEAGSNAMEVDMSQREEAKKEENKNQQVPVSNSEKAMKELKMKFLEQGVYLYYCPQCD